MFPAYRQAGVSRDSCPAIQRVKLPRSYGGASRIAEIFPAYRRAGSLGEKQLPDRNVRPIGLLKSLHSSPPQGGVFTLNDPEKGHFANSTME